MRIPMKAPVLVLAAFLAAAIVVAGCGGGSSSGGGGEPASLAPSNAPVYLEVDLGAEGKSSEEFNELAHNVLGIENVGEYVAEQLEEVALGEGEKFNFEEEVEPWLGEKAGMYLDGYDGNNFHGYGVIFETTNAGEAEEFIEERVEANQGESEEGEFEGDKYYVESDGETVLGVIGGYLVFGETKADFESMVKTSEEGEGLNESATFKQATESVTSEGIGSVYVDIGGLIDQAKGKIDAETEAGFALLGIEPRNATAVATVIPHSEQVEIDLTTDVTKAAAPGGDASKLLEALPATAVLGFAAPEFGKTFGEGIHEFSEKGVPGQLKPGELEAAFGTLGINVEQLSASIGDAAGFVEGSSMSSLGGAIEIETSNPTEAKNTVSSIGLLLRATKTAGVTAIGGNLAGFSVHSAALGPKPLIVGAAGEKIVIAYGPKAAAQALRSQAKTLGSTADYEAAKGVLGSTPMTASSRRPGAEAGRRADLARGTGQDRRREAIPGGRSPTSGSARKSGAATTARVIVGLSK